MYVASAGFYYAPHPRRRRFRMVERNAFAKFPRSRDARPPGYVPVSKAWRRPPLALGSGGALAPLAMTVMSHPSQPVRLPRAAKDGLKDLPHQEKFLEIRARARVRGIPGTGRFRRRRNTGIRGMAAPRSPSRGCPGEAVRTPFDTGEDTRIPGAQCPGEQPGNRAEGVLQALPRRRRGEGWAGTLGTVPRCARGSTLASATAGPHQRR